MNEKTIDPRSEVILSEGAKKALANRFGGKLPPLSVLAQRYGAESVRNMTRSEEFRVAAQDVGGFAEPKPQRAALPRADIPPEVSAQIEGARRNDTIARTFFTGVSSASKAQKQTTVQPVATFAQPTGASPVLSTTGQAKPIIGPKSSKAIGGATKSLLTTTIPGLGLAGTADTTGRLYSMLPTEAQSAIESVAKTSKEGLAGFAKGAGRAVTPGGLSLTIARGVAPAGADLLRKARERLSE